MLARDTRTGREKVVQIKSVVDVDDVAVQQMVEESVEHAFEDLRPAVDRGPVARQPRRVAATRKGLTDCPANSRLAPEPRSRRP